MNDRNVQLNDQEIQYIVNVLAERPYKESAPLIVKIVQQVTTPAPVEGDEA